MPLSMNIMGGGFSAGQARAIGGTVNQSVAAAGTTQATATDVTGDNLTVTSGGSGTGIQLYAGNAGDSQLVYNAQLVAVNVYPANGSKINQIAANSAHVLGAQTAAWYITVSSTQTVAFVSA